MSVTVRYYIFAEEGPRRLPKRIMEGLVRGEDALPQYAGTTQRLAEVILKNEDGHPIEITRTSGSYLKFDAGGSIRDGLQQGAFAAWDTFEAVERAGRMSVVDLGPKIKRKQWEKENRWKLSKDQLDLIAADIWGDLPEGVKVKDLKGAAPKPPAFPRDAKYAMTEIQDHLFKMGLILERLSEPALKGLAFRARQMAREGRDQIMWTGVAEVADYRRDVMARHRSGKGNWYAVIEVARQHHGEDYGTIETSAFERCDSRGAAEEAARRLLAENAKYFNHATSIEARLYCELEW